MKIKQGGLHMCASALASRISFKEFLELKDQLIKKLEKRLQEEIDLQEFDNPPEGDLWELPVVDSKTVVKLSPLVEEDTGIKIKNQWIRNGGYDTVDEAINDLIQKIEEILKVN